MKDHWESRYTQEAYAYGIDPNTFFGESLKELPIGRLLLPGEGEGRNAVYAASLGWQVDAFDFSENGREKALKLAKSHHVSLSYTIEDYAHFDPEPQQYDAIGLIYTHMTPDIRTAFHERIAASLKPGGILILQAFSKHQLGKTTGGPKQMDMLFSMDELREDFKGLTIEKLEELDVDLSEGTYHQGIGSIIRMIAKKE